MITLGKPDIIMLILGFIVALICAIIAIRLSKQTLADLIAYDLRQQTDKLREENRAILDRIRTGRL